MRVKRDLRTNRLTAQWMKETSLLDLWGLASMKVALVLALRTKRVMHFPILSLVARECLEY